VASNLTVADRVGEGTDTFEDFLDEGNLVLASNLDMLVGSGAKCHVQNCSAFGRVPFSPIKDVLDSIKDWSGQLVK
jgi:hypothetical protein